MFRGWRGLVVVAALWACDDGGSADDKDAGAGGADGGSAGGGGDGGGAGDVVSRIEEEVPYTAAHSEAYDAMLSLVTADGFTKEGIGDPADYQLSAETTPTQPDQLSSLFFETAELKDRLSTLRDRREGLDPGRTDDRLAQRIALDLTLGFAGDGPPDTRGGAGWHGRQAVRTLEAYLLITAAGGLVERSAAGFDRAVATLWDDAGVPRGLGAVIAAGDAACGTAHLEGVRSTLAGVREPFLAALEQFGLPDPLDRLTFEPGQSAEYDAAIDAAIDHLEKGVAAAFRRILTASPMTALDQAEALGAYNALMARVGKTNSADDNTIGQQLDQAAPGDIDVAAINQILQTHFGVGPCAR